MKYLSQKNSFNSRLLPLILLALLSSLCLFSCSKKKDIRPELPPITQEGKNTFGCMFGNEIWLPGKHLSTSSLDVRYSVENGFRIYCGRNSPLVQFKRDNMVLRMTDIAEVGTYDLTSQNTEIYIDTKQPNDLPSLQYILHNAGTIKITRFDTSNKIASGEFAFQVKEKTTGEVVEVTQGRFDAELKLY